MSTISMEVLLSITCGYCENLPTRPPIHQRISDQSLVCADCWSFITHNNRIDDFIRQTKLEILLPFIKSCVSSASQSPASLNSSDFFESLAPETPLLLRKSSPNVKENLNVSVNCKLKGNKTTKKATVLQYSMNVEKQSGSKQQLCLVNDENIDRIQRYVKPVDLFIEGMISLTKNPQQVYGRIETIPRCDHIYETIQSRHGSGVSHLNLEPPLPEQKTFCGNGCIWRGSTADVSEHYKNCTMANIICWFDACGYQGPEQFMKWHLNNKHKEHIQEVITGKFLRKDYSCIVIKNGIVFVFKYFYYDTLEVVEMMVQAVVNRTEINYKYCVNVFKDPEKKKVFSKTAKCLIYNKCILQTGIKFEKHDLTDFRNCVYTVDIIQNL